MEFASNTPCGSDVRPSSSSIAKVLSIYHWWDKSSIGPEFKTLDVEAN